MKTEWIRIYPDRGAAESDMNEALKDGYDLLDFQMKLSHGSYGGESAMHPRFEERYFVHMRKLD